MAFCDSLAPLAECSQVCPCVTCQHIRASLHFLAKQYPFVRRGHVFVIHHLLMGEAWLLRFGQVPKGITRQCWGQTSEQPPAATLALGDRALVDKRRLPQVPLV